MTEATTRIRKSIRGTWQAETDLPLGFTSDEGNPAELHLSTYKSERGLATYVGVKFRDGAFITTRVFRDFHCRCELSALRCTEANVTRQHEFWLARLDTLKADALAFHAAKGDLPPAPEAEAA